MALQRAFGPGVRTRVLVAVAAGVVITLGGTVGSGAAAWAQDGARAVGLHGGPVRPAARHGVGAAKLPVIGNATELRRKPVVHATKGNPPTRLEVKDLVVGTGKRAKASSTVSVMYVGANYKTGRDFTQVTWKEKDPTTFPLSNVVAGFREGLVGMRVGGRREIVIPPALGYGDGSTGPIKANETLVFVVDLKGVEG